MEAHHDVWLSEHPHRSEAWLKKMLKDGFDIHHLDGDHSNNDPSNLVMIEHTDHMMLHMSKRNLGRIAPKRRTREVGRLIRLSRVRRERILEIYEQTRRSLPAMVK